MKVLLKIAFRNLKEHKTKTIIIGSIISIGIAVLILGNAFIYSSQKRLENLYIENYTGHVMITVDEDDMWLVKPPMDINEIVPKIPEYEAVYKFIKDNPKIETLSPQISGRATVSLGEDKSGITMLFGVNPDKYLDMFPNNINILEGQFLQTGKEGIVLSKRVHSNLEDSLETKLNVGDKILLSGINSSGNRKIREVKIIGIFEFVNTNTQLDMVSFIDTENIRVLNGMTMHNESEIKWNEGEKELLGSFDEADLFSLTDDSILTETTNTSSNTDYDKILGDSKSVYKTETDKGSWYYLLLKLKNNTSSKTVISQLNSYFKTQNINARASDWTSGAGMIAQITVVFQYVFIAIITVIAIVAVIIIMNTIVISVSERFKEIGTMRAIGAQKGFIRKMITWETLIISMSFGFFGIILGSVISSFISEAGIIAPNMFFKIIFGGETLNPQITFSSIVQSLGIVSVIGIISSLYPASIALKIEPVKAMQS